MKDHCHRPDMEEPAVFVMEFSRHEMRVLDSMLHTPIASPLHDELRNQMMAAVDRMLRSDAARMRWRPEEGA